MSCPMARPSPGSHRDSSIPGGTSRTQEPGSVGRDPGPGGGSGEQHGRGPPLLGRPQGAVEVDHPGAHEPTARLRLAGPLRHVGTKHERNALTGQRQAQAHVDGVQLVRQVEGGLARKPDVEPAHPPHEADAVEGSGGPADGKPMDVYAGRKRIPEIHLLRRDVQLVATPAEFPNEPVSDEPVAMWQVIGEQGRRVRDEDAERGSVSLVFHRGAKPKTCCSLEIRCRTPNIRTIMAPPPGRGTARPCSRSFAGGRGSSSRWPSSRALPPAPTPT